MFFSQGHPCAFELCHVGLQVAIIAIFRNYYRFAILFVVGDNFGECSLCVVQSQDLRVYLPFLINLHPHQSIVAAGSQVRILIEILTSNSVLLETDPPFSLLLDQFLFFFHLRVQ